MVQLARFPGMEMLVAPGEPRRELDEVELAQWHGLFLGAMLRKLLLKGPLVEDLEILNLTSRYGLRDALLQVEEGSAPS